MLRFGAFVGRTTPGINYHLPWPIESVQTPKVTRENQLNIGYRLGSAEGSRDVPEESLMLTGDENIVDINFTVFWVIKDAAPIPVQCPESGRSTRRHHQGGGRKRHARGGRQKSDRTDPHRQPRADPGRGPRADAADPRFLWRRRHDHAGSRCRRPIRRRRCIEAYRDVQAARTDQDRMRNEAEAYANKVVPEARGQAARIIQQAEGYKQQVIAEAQGEAARFISVYDEYKKAPDVTRRRIYSIRCSDILAGMNKVIIDNKSSSGVLPYLPLPELRQTHAAHDRRRARRRCRRSAAMNTHIITSPPQSPRLLSRSSAFRHCSPSTRRSRRWCCRWENRARLSPRPACT